MLLDVHLEIGPPAKIVHYFEIIKEKWPAEEIPFAKIVKVGAAYHEMGEYERSYLVFRATVESSFSGESGVAGFLQAQGEFPRSVDGDGPAAPRVSAGALRGRGQPTPWPSRSTPRPPRRPATPSSASRRSTASTWSAGRGRCWKAS